MRLREADTLIDWLAPTSNEAEDEHGGRSRFVYGRGMTDWLDSVRFGPDGLVPAIAQDAATHRVLTLAWMNRLALERTVATREAHYWSRSRAALWHKGEQSGHVQRVHELRLDCDGDSILLIVEPAGGVACHTGRERCFYRRLDHGEWHTVEPVLEDPATVYGHR